MNIVLTRIDNRLLHGIVMTQWAGTTGAQRVMVIDDKTANSPILKQTMMLAKPAGMAASIEGFKCSRRAFLSEEEVNACKELLNLGVHITVQHVPTDTKVEFSTLI